MASLNDFDILSLALEAEDEANTQEAKVEDALSAIADSLIELDAVLTDGNLDGETKEKVESVAEGLESQFEKLASGKLKASQEGFVVHVGSEDVRRAAKFIIELIQRAYEWLKKTVTNLFDAARRLFSRADKIKTTVDAKKPRTDSSPVEVLSPEVSAVLRNDGKTIEGESNEAEESVSATYAEYVRAVLKTKKAQKYLSHSSMVKAWIKPGESFDKAAKFVSALDSAMEKSSDDFMVLLSSMPREEADTAKEKTAAHKEASERAFLDIVKAHCEARASGSYLTPYGGGIFTVDSDGGLKFDASHQSAEELANYGQAHIEDLWKQFSASSSSLDDALGKLTNNGAAATAIKKAQERASKRFIPNWVKLETSAKQLGSVDSGSSAKVTAMHKAVVFQRNHTSMFLSVTGDFCRTVSNYLGLVNLIFGGFHQVA